MKTEKIYLWNDSGANEKDRPDIVAYIPEQKISDCAFVIFPGGSKTLPYGVVGKAKLLCGRRTPHSSHEGCSPQGRLFDERLLRLKNLVLLIYT